MFEHRARKRFGQHFLCDEYIIQRIIAAIAPKQEDHLVEIGPGFGAITLPLLPMVSHIDAIELDKEIIPILKEKALGLGCLTIHEQDALHVALQALTSHPKSLRIVGNLPYNISTPLLFHLFAQGSFIKDMHFMLQEEVGQRLVAASGSKQFGRLSVMAQYYCDIELLFGVPPSSFSPPPKVNSVFLRLIPRPFPTSYARDINKLEWIVRLAFTKRRKTLQNALKNYITKDQLLNVNINPALRPEALTVENFVKISNILSGG